MRGFIKKHRILTAVVIIGICGLFIAAYEGAFYYVPSMKQGEKKIGLVITTIEDNESDLLIYDENLNLQRQKRLHYAGLGASLARCPIANQQIFLETTGISGVGIIEEFIAIHLEKETIAKYPVSHKTALTAVAANQNYAYAVSNLNGTSTLTQHRHLDKKEIAVKKFSDLLIEMVAANEDYVFLAISSADSSRTINFITVLNANSLDTIREIPISREEYGKFAWNNYLLTEEALYLPFPLSSKAWVVDEESKNKTGKEKDIYDPRKEEAKLNNKILKLSLKDFSFSMIELARKAPRRIEKKGDFLFVIQENQFYKDAYLTIYNEITGKQDIYVWEDMFFLNFAISDNELYVVGLDSKVGYSYIYRYEISEDNQITFKNKKLLPDIVTGMYVYEKEEAEK
jgi:hypothetical protein